MLVEIALLQRLSLLLGHPTLALTVGLFGLLFWSGLGSRFGSTRLRVVIPALLATLATTWWLLDHGT